jgi:predicted site-specific integrase-resolvase
VSLDVVPPKKSVVARRLADTETIVLAHRDRLVRGPMVDCKAHGCAILVPKNESLSPEQEMVQDLKSIMHLVLEPL